MFTARHRENFAFAQICKSIDLLRTGIAKIGMLFNRNIDPQVFENHVDWSWHKFSPGSGELIHLKKKFKRVLLGFGRRNPTEQLAKARLRGAPLVDANLRRPQLGFSARYGRNCWPRGNCKGGESEGQLRCTLSVRGASES